MTIWQPNPIPTAGRFPPRLALFAKGVYLFRFACFACFALLSPNLSGFSYLSIYLSTMLVLFPRSACTWVYIDMALLFFHNMEWNGLVTGLVRLIIYVFH